MGFYLSDIKRRFDNTGLISSQLGDDALITGIKSVESSGPGDLVFVNSNSFMELALQKQPAAVVVSENLAEEAAQNSNWGVLVVTNVKLAHAHIKQAYSDRDFIDTQWGTIHPSAVIHPTAIIPTSCYISPHVVIGQNARLGERCRILSGVVIENDVDIGCDCIIHPNSVIGYNCIIGNEVEICAGSIIGSEGFGFAQDKQGKSSKIPQTGKVVIEDRVRVGACNTIDRATYGQTRIGTGTKTDNQVHIGHNVDIGEDCLFTAMLVVGGSSKIGDRCITSGQIEISDHMTVSDDVMLVHRAGVRQDIVEPGMYAGLPTQPLKQYMKNTAHLIKLSELSKKVISHEKILRSLKDEK